MNKKLSLQEKIIYADRKFCIYDLYNKKIRAFFYEKLRDFYEKQLEKSLTK